jgi:hypothetical protein
MNFLDNVQLAFECPLRWEKLAGGDRKRFCSTCERHVHNLSAMTRPEASAFLRNNRAPICVRVEVDAHGRAIHRPGLAAVALAATLAACGTEADTGFDSGFTAAYEGNVVEPSRGARGTIPDPAVVLGRMPLRGVEVEHVLLGEPATQAPVERMGAMPAPQERMGDYAPPNPEK